MKSKLTITIDESIIPKLKVYARMKNSSLSQLIEDTFRQFVVTEKASFARRWRGRFRSDGKHKKSRLDYLFRRFLA